MAGTPDTLEEWIEPAWVRWMTREDPSLQWLSRGLKARVQDFEMVLTSRFPSLHDVKTRHWGKVLAQMLAKRRWDRERHTTPACCAE